MYHERDSLTFMYKITPEGFEITLKFTLRLVILAKLLVPLQMLMRSVFPTIYSQLEV